jgi:predicted amidophosphoribosyltransferase
MNEDVKLCPTCKEKLTHQPNGNLICQKCENNKKQKDLYEEAFFDLQDYKKRV